MNREALDMAMPSKFYLRSLLEKFAPARSQFDKLMKDPQQMDLVLKQGAQKAQEIAEDVLSRVRSRLGFLT